MFCTQEPTVDVGEHAHEPPPHVDCVSVPYLTGVDVGKRAEQETLSGTFRPIANAPGSGTQRARGVVPPLHSGSAQSGMPSQSSSMPLKQSSVVGTHVRSAPGVR